MSEGSLEDFGLEVDDVESPRCDVCGTRQDSLTIIRNATLCDVCTKKARGDLSKSEAWRDEFDAATEGDSNDD